MVGQILSERVKANQDQINDLIGLFSVGALFNTLSPINRNHDFVYRFAGTGLPSLDYKHKSFGDAACLAASDLWHQAQSRDIVLYWSGGIDSTAALVALIQTCSQWHQRLQIFTTRYAVEREYAWFYHQFLRDTRIRILEPHEFYDSCWFTPEIIAVNGECGDQIWGSKQLQQIPDLWHQPWRVILTKPEFLNGLGWSRWIPSTLQYIENQVQKFPVPVDTVADLYWMLPFGHKWDSNRYFHMARVGHPQLMDSMYAFYDNVHLQSWSMQNMCEKIGNTWQSYKMPAKNFIFDFTNDCHYRDNKTAFGSLTSSLTKEQRRPKIIAVTDQGVITTDQFVDLAWLSWQW